MSLDLHNVEVGHCTKEEGCVLLAHGEQASFTRKPSDDTASRRTKRTFQEMTLSSVNRRAQYWAIVSCATGLHVNTMMLSGSKADTGLVSNGLSIVSEKRLLLSSHSSFCPCLSVRLSQSLCVCVCVCVCVRARVSACVRVCVREWVSVCVLSLIHIWRCRRWP